MVWKVKTKYGTVYAESKSELPPLDEDFVKDAEYTEVDRKGVSGGLNDRLVQEVLTFVQSFQGEIYENEVSVKMLKTGFEELTEVVEKSLEVQVFVLNNQKNFVNMLDLGKIEERQRVESIQERIDELENQLDRIEDVREGEIFDE